MNLIRSPKIPYTVFVSKWAHPTPFGPGRPRESDKCLVLGAPIGFNAFSPAGIASRTRAFYG